ncbi:hypothetical protein M422DRAFT_240741 [Sphaerobolus stellatus SS14]|nr:hypothetical protein M422DRAFT_240741 [Sphaerobolus stellatus SS14]
MPKTVGAPAQHSQPSRKGKKAWRKNVDIEKIEQGLEAIRDEERIAGDALHKKADEQLFQIDITGNENLKRVLPKFDSSQLMSSKVLAQRSAAPALFARTSKPASTVKLTREEKAKLLRMGKRKVKGPFNTYVDPSEPAPMEVSEAVKNSGQYDVWGAEPDPVTTVLKGKGKFVEPQDYLLPLVTKPDVKPPKSGAPLQNSIAVRAVAHPHQGTSYNPLETAHRELLLSAHEIEVRKETEQAKLTGLKDRMEAARKATLGEEGAAGMIVDNGEYPIEEESSSKNEDNLIPTNKPPPRKTLKQRKKATLLLAQRRALIEQKHRKRLAAVALEAKSLRSKLAKSARARQAILDTRKVAEEEKLRKQGLIGQRIGKHRVQEGKVDVQLGDELVESFRELKPEGNLFRDRFLSLQQRALVEPRVRVLPKRRKTKTKDYEKHAWKRFDLQS